MLKHVSPLRAGAIAAALVCSFGATADELVWATTNWHNSSTERSNVYAGQFPKDTEIADDFDVTGPISQVVMAGRGCSQCQPPTVLGVFVRFYEWTNNGPGTLQEEYFLEAGDPNFDYNPTVPSLLRMTLETPFVASGKHFVAVQINFDGDGGWWAPGIAGRANPMVGPCYFRDNLGSGEWEVEIDYLGYMTDVQFELWAPDEVQTPWEYVPSPPATPAHFWNVKDITGPDDVWAVGFEKVYFNQFSYDSHSLAAHWDGQQWTRIESPSPGAYEGGGITVDLRDVAGVASDDVWAVGSYEIQHPGDGFLGFQTFAMYYDGSEWSHVETPVTAVGSTGAGLWAVEAVASDNVYAVGWRADPNFGDQVDWIGHAIHWDGSEWSSLPDPPLGGRRNDFLDLAMLGPNRFIAIGGHSGQTYGATDQPYVVEWNNGQWNTINVPVPPGQNFLQSITVLSPDNIWIAGTNDQVNEPFRPLFIHFDGSSWTVFDNVELNFYGATIRSITAIAPDDMWASGSFTSTQGGFTRPFLMHFDGVSWKQVATDPDGPDGGTLFAIDAVGDTGEVWTVGTAGNHTHSQRLPGDPDSSQNAPLVSAQVTFGQLLSGGVPELITSDDAYLRTRSGIGFSALEPNLMHLEVTAVSPLATTNEFDLAVESRINHPTGTATIRVRNASSNQWQSIGSYSIGMTETTQTYTGISAANRINGSDEIRVQVKQVVPAVFSALGFDSSFDLVEFTVR